MRRSLILMVKEPRAGKVKTRLGREIGMTGAAWWFRHQTAHLLRSLQDPRWTCHLAVDPVTAMTSRAWPSHLPRLSQGHGDLGQRMAHSMAQTHGPTVLIGADIPGVTPARINRAFRALGSADIVLGPAEDGGFWLVGLARTRPFPPALFNNVRWSTNHALADTVDSAGDLRIAYADTLADVDTAADLPVGRRPG